jgi:hypothetical protein
MILVLLAVTMFVLGRLSRKKRFGFLMTQTRFILGFLLAGEGIALGGNDNPLWLSGYPMSQETQTLVFLVLIAVGAVLLSSVVTDFQQAFVAVAEKLEQK